jgi:hypothetical protein
MPNTQIACAYTARATGQSAVNLGADLAEVPIETSLPLIWGCTPKTDATVIASPDVTRTITLAIGSAFSSSGGITVTGGSPRGSIASAIFTSSPPTDYGAPPIVSFTDTTGSGATAAVTMAAGAFNILSGGSGYTGATTAAVVGGNLAPGGRVATVTPHFTLGVLTSITIVDGGVGYTSFAEVVLTDSGGGSGAVVFMTLTPVGIAIYQPGSGYTAPTMRLTPWFTSGAPDDSNQAGCFSNWMTEILAAGAGSVVSAALPVLS